MPSGGLRPRGRARRVSRTGLAVVHRGELVLPAAGSEAQAERVGEDARAVIHYHFPVIIEVRGAPEARSPEDVVAEALDRAAQGLENA